MHAAQKIGFVGMVPWQSSHGHHDSPKEGVAIQLIIPVCPPQRTILHPNPTPVIYYDVPAIRLEAVDLGDKPHGCPSEGYLLDSSAPCHITITYWKSITGVKTLDE